MLHSYDEEGEGVELGYLTGCSDALCMADKVLKKMAWDEASDDLWSESSTDGE